MAAGDSTIGICNKALSLLGEGAITALSDKTKAARECSTSYDLVRRAELRRYPWNCAQTRAAIPAAATPPAFGYGNAFPVPNDFIRFWNARDDAFDGWTIENGQILTDLSAPLQIIYIFDLTDPTRFDPLLVKVLAYQLAIEICMSLTQSSARKTELQNSLAEFLPQAQLVDSQENSPKEWDEDVWLRARQ